MPGIAPLLHPRLERVLGAAAIGGRVGLGETPRFDLVGAFYPLRTPQLGGRAVVPLVIPVHSDHRGEVSGNVTRRLVSDTALSLPHAPLISVGTAPDLWLPKAGIRCRVAPALLPRHYVRREPVPRRPLMLDPYIPIIENGSQRPVRGRSSLPAGSACARSVRPASAAYDAAAGEELAIKGRSTAHQ